MTNRDILKDHSESAVIRAMTANFVGVSEIGFHHFPKPYTVDFTRYDDMLRCFTGIPLVIFNAVIPYQIDEERLENRIIETIEFFRSRKVPHTWWISPMSKPRKIEEVLASQGLMKDPWDQPIMAIDLRQLDNSKLEEASDKSGATVKIVESQADFDGYMRVFHDAYETSGDSVRIWQTFSENLFHDRDNTFFILAEIDGEPVGCALSSMKAGVAGVYMVGTPEKHRGKGVGSLVTMAALMQGKKKGYEIGMLKASKMGLNVYERLGFKEYYRMHTYYDILQ